MKLIQIILALVCFGVGFLIAGSDYASSPVVTVLVIAVILGVGMILRNLGNKNK